MADDNDLGNAVVIERTFDAPAELIWQMWTDPDHFAGWYGPPGASIPVARMDVRVGGTRLVCMVVETPNGTMRMWFTGEYREVVASKRLVYTDSVSDEHGNVLSPSEMGMPDGHPTTTEVIVELAEIDGRTKMVMTHVGIPAGSPGAMAGRWHSTSSASTSRHTESEPSLPWRRGGLDAGRCRRLQHARDGVCGGCRNHRAG